MLSIVAAILTGNRPDLLDLTLEGTLPYLKKCQRIMVLHNGGDAPTVRVLERYGRELDIDVLTHDGPMIPTGTSHSILALAAAKTGCDLLFWNEDDFVPVPELVQSCPHWFELAAELASDPSVGQVRLRRESDLAFCSPVNFIDGRGAAWSVAEDGSFMTAPHHWSFNVSMQRCAVLGDGLPEKTGERFHGVYPAESERHAQARFYAANLWVAQLRPGIFAHAGDGRSLDGH